jgi:hypothetical protein
LLIEQHSSSEVVGGGTPSSRRLLWAYTDIWGAGEVSPTRGLAAWLALAVSLLMVVLLLLGA